MGEEAEKLEKARKEIHDVRNKMQVLLSQNEMMHGFLKGISESGVSPKTKMLIERFLRNFNDWAEYDQDNLI